MGTERKHALLSASSAHIWMHCPPSERLGESFPDSAGRDAAEGTLAHAIAELKLRKAFIEPMGARTFSTRMNKLKKDPLYQDEMQGHTDTYIEYITECAMKYSHTPVVAAETRLDYSAWVPEGFGTADAILVGNDTLQIVDFKYGKGVPVSAEGNVQLRLYALGALGLYSIVYPISHVKMAIVQPRLDSITEDEITVEELLDWAENAVKPTALQAWEGKGCWVVTASNKDRVPVVGPDLQPIIDSTEIYSGMWANVGVTLFGYNAPTNKGIGVALDTVQKIRDDEPLGGTRASVEDDFAGLVQPDAAPAPQYTVPSAVPNTGVPYATPQYAAPSYAPQYAAPRIDPITGLPY